MSSNRFLLIILLMNILLLISGCIAPESEPEVKYVYITVTPTPVKTPRQITHVSTVRVTPLPTQTPTYPRYKPKFEWGDIIQDPNYNKYIILEGHPEISGVYTVYKMVWCPCVRKGFLDVQNTDNTFRKVGTQNPDTICGGAQLKILTDPEESCYYPNTGVVL